MKRLRNLLLGVAVAMAFLFVNEPRMVDASTFCHGDYYLLVLYQDANYGGDCLGLKDAGLVGNHAAAGLYNMNSMAGPCWHPGFPASWSWGDCVSSLKWSINSCHWHFSLYQDVGYGGTVLYSYDGGPNVNIASMPTGKNDQASSALVYYTSGCVQAPAP